jgi:hypothetical protein
MHLHCAIHNGCGLIHSVQFCTVLDCWRSVPLERFAVLADPSIVAGTFSSLALQLEPVSSLVGPRLKERGLSLGSTPIAAGSAQRDVCSSDIKAVG